MRIFDGGVTIIHAYNTFHLFLCVISDHDQGRVLIL